MTTPWQSLYLSCVDRDAVVSALRDSLVALRYELYDPFGLIPGNAYPQTVRLFVAPPQADWVRVIGEPDARLLPDLSRLGLCLGLALDGSAARIAVYAHGEQADPQSALTAHLRPASTADDLRRALAESPAAGNEARERPAPDSLPLDALPEDVQAMAQGVDLRQAQKMFNRLSGQLLKKGDSAAARELLAGNAPDWDSPGGRQLAALMACLTAPENWREPDFTTLRDAYQLHARRRRSPSARLYPGDAEALAKVPDALEYVPVYGGLNP